MKLYHNCDIIDLEKILEEGLLPLSKTNNDKWENKKRGDNSRECVYLFKPIGKVNSFPNSYGIVLLEVETEANEVEMARNDVHFNDYKEYTTSEVTPSEIKKIYAPKIFRKKIEKIISEEVLKKIKFVEIEATYYDEEIGKEIQKINNTLIEKYGYFKVEILENPRVPAPKEVIERFGETAEITMDFNFFRGVDENNRTIDIYDIEYVF